MIIVSLTAGATYASIDGDGSLMIRDSVMTQLTRLLAGRAAEELLLGCVSGGAGGSETSDLAHASNLALDAIANGRLSALGHPFGTTPQAESCWNPVAVKS